MSDALIEKLSTLAADFTVQTAERLKRTSLDRVDFDRIAETGYLNVGIPKSHGGLFESIPASTRLICECLRTLAQGDPSVALVSAMHPAVTFFWLCKDEVPEPHAEAWRKQRNEIFEGIKRGDSWGTITSEPGSGGDVAKTKTVAQRVTGSADGDVHAYTITGDKHFGSGSGMHSFMTTTALPEGEVIPDFFFLNLRDAPWDGSTGCKLIAEWDGHGMAATQSHAFRFENFPATRFAWPGNILQIAPLAGAWGNCLFTAVIVGVLQRAMGEARAKMAAKKDTLRPYEQVEWTRAVNEAWLVDAAYESMLQAFETQPLPLEASLRSKQTIAELAENALTRTSRALGGGSFSRRAPFGQWAQDVKALGFLRPPWGLSFDQMRSFDY